MNAPAGNEELGRRIRRLRAERHLTLKQVEEASGLSATHLSEIERGRTSPTIGALVRLARALGKSASFFIEAQELAEMAHVPRGRLREFVAPGGARVEPLTRGVPGSHLFAYRLTLEPVTARLAVEAQELPGDALYFVRRGRVETALGENCLTLSAGDAAQAPLTRPHLLRAAGDGAAEVIAVLTRPIEPGD